MFKKFFLAAALAATVFAPSVNAQSTIWGWDLGGTGGLFNLDDATAPATWTYFRPPTYSAFAMDFDQTSGDLVAFDNDGITIGVIDEANGSYASNALISGDLDVVNFNIIGLAHDPTDGTMYCCDAERIFTIDVATGVTTLVGDLAGVGFDIASNVMITIDIDNAGQMYGFEFDASAASGSRGDNGRLWEIDKTSGTMSVLGSSGVAEVGFVQGMDFDPATNTLHSAIFAFNGAFPLLGDYGTWDLSTPGTATFTALDPLSAGATDMELVFAISGGIAYGQDVFNDVFAQFNVGDITSWTPLTVAIPTVWSLEAGSDGVIYALDNNGAGTDDFLGTFNQSTGVFTETLALSGDYTTSGSQQPAALTQDVSTGTWYVVDLFTLFELDITTGACTLIGSFDAGVLAIEGSAFGGQMFIFDAATENLLEVSLIDGTTVATVGNIGFDVGLAIQGMDHDETGLLYQAAIGDAAGTNPTGSYGTWTGGVFTEIVSADLLPDPDADGVQPKITFLGPPVGVVDVTPATLNVTVGVIANGSGLNELQTSDNVDLSLFRNPSLVSSRTEFIATASSPVAAPTTFDVTLEGSVFARRPVTQTVALFDYDAGAFEIVSTETARQFSDLTVVASGTGDLSRFVGPGNEIQVRVRYQGSVNRLTFASNTDHFFWSIQ